MKASDTETAARLVRVRDGLRADLHRVQIATEFSVCCQATQEDPRGMSEMLPEEAEGFERIRTIVSAWLNAKIGHIEKAMKEIGVEP